MSSPAHSPSPSAPGYLPTFCLHFVLPNCLLLIASMVSGAFGGEFGITYLIWHENPAKQFWVGYALGLVVVQCLYVGFLMWAKKTARPEKLQLSPRLLDRFGPHLFFHYSMWVLGQLLLLLAVVSGLILLVQTLDQWGEGPPPLLDTTPLENSLNAIPPPRPSYGPWLVIGGLSAAGTIFLGGWLFRFLINLGASGDMHGLTRRIFNRVIASAENQPASPHCGSMLLTLWDIRQQNTPLRKFAMVLFNQTLLMSVGVVFAAVWELSNLGVAVGVLSGMVLFLLLFRSRWLNDQRFFRSWLLLLGVMVYFVVTWLGSKSWCGWSGAYFVGLFCLSVIPLGIRYTFPLPTAHALRQTYERIIDPRVCRKYPFHGIAALFFLFGVVVLFVLPMTFASANSPMVLMCFLMFMGIAIYGLVAYVIDDALPFLAPALLVMIVLSGMPQYKMQFPGLDYSGKDSPEGQALLDLEATIKDDVARQQKFDQAVANNIVIKAGLMARGKSQTGGSALVTEAQLEAQWKAVEDDNRILPGKDLRPLAAKSLPGRLLMPGDIPFASVPATTDQLTKPLPAVADRDPKNSKKKPMVIVVASGGGIRAAAWTYMVMAELEHRFAKEGIPFPYHVRMITGASGGMFGASYYVQSLKPPGEMSWGQNRRTEMEGRFDKLTQDWLSPIVERMVLNDVPAFFSPFSTHTDRGIALEQAWSKSLEGDLDIKFEGLAEKERAGWCPSLVFTPMLVEDGRRLIISNLDMRYPASNDGHLIDCDPERPDALCAMSRNYSHEALELFRMFPNSRNKFALSTAVRMSASFPYFSPAVPLPTKPRRRVVDAGYFDNYGVSLAAAYLFSKKNSDWYNENVSKIVVVQIRDGQSDDERRLQAIPDSPSRKKGLSSLLSRSLEEITSPLEGLTNGRVGTCSFRNDGLLELLSTYFEQMRGEPGSGKLPHSQRFFTVVNFEFPGHASLSWHLSGEEERQMKGTFAEKERAEDLRMKIAQLIEWWKSDVYETPQESRSPKVRLTGFEK
ncbi:patatin-like phospholipase family protein [Zavarzinella formosa]|uniref:patatin-like phospholipase family protein n=1 Tax=Zavarzinella formosa TaxID=360055 RepID=UPI000316C25A|nr:patatin-like phospholipase family protein [Zavarzinella formosa]